MYKEDCVTVALCIMYCCGDDPLNNITLISSIFLCLILIFVILLLIFTCYVANKVAARE